MAKRESCLCGGLGCLGGLDEDEEEEESGAFGWDEALVLPSPLACAFNMRLSRNRVAGVDEEPVTDFLAPLAELSVRRAVEGDDLRDTAFDEENDALEHAMDADEAGGLLLLTRVSLASALLLRAAFAPRLRLALSRIPSTLASASEPLDSAASSAFRDSSTFSSPLAISTSFSVAKEDTQAKRDA